MPRKPYGIPDADNPEITTDEMGQGRPAHDVLPQIFAADGHVTVPVLPRRRGKQKAATKQLVSLRLDRQTLAEYRATGRGWQSRIDEDLAAAARRRARRTRTHV
ncbi:MAG: BrnA antitoxin family protein [Acidobacteriaceae bacterium]|jgi:uncharacterized protein (DUF4415 family)|nr:BrnA antitoxin family protein [Acidobacteriaceae bacterium]